MASSGTCEPSWSTCQNGDVKLNSYPEGVLLSLEGGEWTPNCHAGFNDHEASRLCQRLGYSDGHVLRKQLLFEPDALTAPTEVSQPMCAARQCGDAVSGGFYSLRRDYCEACLCRLRGGPSRPKEPRVPRVSDKNKEWINMPKMDIQITTYT